VLGNDGSIVRQSFWTVRGKIQGELRKLGFELCRATVSAILRESGLEPGPDRSDSTWAEFIKRHAATLWACDFFTKTGWTISGPMTFLFIQIETRKIHIAGITTNPDDLWMKQQARNMTMLFNDEPAKPTHLILDNDTKYTKGFCRIFEEEGIQITHTAYQAPNQNAYCERAIVLLRRAQHTPNLPNFRRFPSLRIPNSELRISDGRQRRVPAADPQGTHRNRLPRTTRRAHQELRTQGHLRELKFSQTFPRPHSAPNRCER
jgi:hypothetical protein